MSTKKTATKKNPKNPETPVQVLREATCKSLEGSATLTYQIGIDDDGTILFKISGNTGGGFWSAEWVSFTDIQAAFEAWGTDTPITSMALRPIFRGKSVNTPSFMLAALSAEGLLEPMPKRKRVHRACDPAVFLATVEELKKGTGIEPGKKAAAIPKAEAKDKPAAKAKTPTQRSAKTAKTPRKSPATSRKGK